jgi:hypothetical protein
MTAQLKAQQISTFLTSKRLHDGTWRGSQANFILNWKEQSRVHNDISPDPFTDPQLINFLHACVSGTPNLSQVLTLRNTASRAAGVTTPYTFSEYVQALLEQAAVHDAGRTHTTNPRARRSVNQMEIIFDDNTTGNMEYEVCVHDMDTSIDQLSVFQSDTNPVRRKVMMNKSTWTSLEKDDQVNWDRITDKGKQTILFYHSNRESSSQGNNSGYNCQANVHEQLVDPRGEKKEPTLEIEARTHERSSTSPSMTTTENFNNLLHMATHQTQISKAPKQHKREVNTHEFVNRDHSYEVFTHEFNYPMVELMADIEPARSYEQSSP